MLQILVLESADSVDLGAELSNCLQEHRFPDLKAISNDLVIGSASSVLRFVKVSSSCDVS
jgi:hypothetical protein